MAASAAFLFALNKGYAPLGGVLLVAGTTGFVVLAVRHDRIKRRLERETRLLEINRAGTARMDGKWKGFHDAGAEFSDDGHAFSGDLDIFGHASLFQWICAAETRLGRIRLAGILGNPNPHPETIRRNQAILRELARNIGWRQDFQAAGREISRSKEDPDALTEWGENAGSDFLSARGALGILLMGLMGPILAAVCALVFRNAYLALAAPVLNGLVLLRYQARCKTVIASLCRQRRNLEAYWNLLRLIETAGFEDAGLLELASPVRNAANPSSLRIKRLQSIADWLDVRQNPFIHVILNLLFLWDLQWVAAFQRWRRDHGRSLREWLECIAGLEALASLSIIHFENPGWVFPEIDPASPIGLRAHGLAHPLIAPSHAVPNDFRMGDEGIVILTGSNMSGKSTLLRTVGINLVLAYAGAPVCATELEAGRMKIMTSMRLKDDLDKGLSSFYAELLRIKSIVGASRSEGTVLFLIDEIFRGTNSIDRITGASEVLTGLAESGAKGIVSTHDLELGRLATEHPGSFANYHFTEHFVDGKIRFDYKLRTGISTTRNALHLLRMVGIRPD